MTSIEVQLVPVVGGAADDPVLTGRLGAADREAIGRLGFATDRDRAVTERAAVRLELGRRLGVHPRLVPLLAPEVTGGRPVVGGTTIGIGWAHSGAWVALALAGDRPVGIAIEAVPNRVPVESLAAIGLSSIEDFVAREAAGRATGEGLRESWPRNVCVRPFEAPAGYLGAVAAPGHDWTIELKPFEPHEPPAVASATAVGVWDTTLVGSRKPAYAGMRR